jgi:hypothetical protein
LDDVFKRVVDHLDIEVPMNEMTAAKGPDLTWESEHPLEIIHLDKSLKRNSKRKRAKSIDTIKNDKEEEEIIVSAKEQKLEEQQELAATAHVNNVQTSLKS